MKIALAFFGADPPPQVRTIALRASRVRVGGRIEQEEFDGVRTPLLRRA
jgi:hypothetical protein